MDNVEIKDLKSRLRSKTLGRKKTFKTEILSWEGDDFEIRQPSVAQRSAIMARAMVIDEDGKLERIDTGQLQLWSVVCCTYVPGTNVAVFEDGDAESMSAFPSGDFVDKFSAVAQKLMKVDPEEMEKNLKETAQDYSSTE